MKRPPKSSGPPKAQKDRHDEAKTIRFRAVTTLIRIGRDNKPIPFEQRALAKAVLQSSSANPPAFGITVDPELPSNVVDFIQKSEERQQKIDSKPKATSGNEAEQLQHPEPVNKDTKAGPPQGFLHSTSMCISEFRKLAAIAKAGKVPVPTVWVKNDKGKLESQELSLQRAASLNSQPKPKKLKFKTPPSINHNPMLHPEGGGYSHKPETKVVQYGGLSKSTYYAVAPSGRAVKDFLKNGKYPPYEKPESSVVYTTPASNDGDYVVRRSTEHWNASNMLGWFIKTVDTAYWPSIIADYVIWQDDTPLVDNSAVNEALAKEQDRLLLKAIIVGLQDYTRWSDDKLTSLISERNLMGYELAHYTGDVESKGEFAKEMEKYGTAYAKPPEDAATLLAEFKMHEQMRESTSPLEAYSRFVYGGPETGHKIQAYAQEKCEASQEASRYRLACRRLFKMVRQVPAMLAINQHRAFAAMRRGHIHSTVNMEHEVRALKRMRRYQLRKKDSTYYSRLDYKKIIQNNIKCKSWKLSNQRLISNVGYWKVNYVPIESTLALDCVPSPEQLKTYADTYEHCKINHSYIKWWKKHEAEARLRYMNSTKVGRLTLATTSVLKKLVEVGNTELNPLARKRKEEELVRKAENKARNKAYAAKKKKLRQEERAEAAAKADASASKAKQESIKRSEDRAAKLAARAAFNNAH